MDFGRRTAKADNDDSLLLDELAVRFSTKSITLG